MNLAIRQELEVVTFTRTDETEREQARLIFSEAFPLLRDADFDKCIDKAGRLGFLAINAEDEPTGMAILSLDTSDYVGTSEARLEHMGVSREARRQGIGNTLVRHAIQAAQVSGKRIMSLESSSMAERLYRSNGFVRTGQGREMRRYL